MLLVIWWVYVSLCCVWSVFWCVRIRFYLYFLELWSIYEEDMVYVVYDYVGVIMFVDDCWNCIGMCGD